MKKLLLISILFCAISAQAQLKSSGNIEVVTDMGYPIVDKPLMFVMGKVSTPFQYPYINVQFIAYDMQEKKYIEKSVTLSANQNREIITLLAQMCEIPIEEHFKMEFSIDTSFINQMTTNTLN